eukprot:2931044-Pyramimonas_sp.AAC.1
MVSRLRGRQKSICRPAGAPNKPPQAVEASRGSDSPKEEPPQDMGTGPQPTRTEKGSQRMARTINVQREEKIMGEEGTKENVSAKTETRTSYHTVISLSLYLSPSLASYLSFCPCETSGTRVHGAKCQ